MEKTMSSVKHMMFLSKNVKTPLLLEVKVGFVYGLKGIDIYPFLFMMTTKDLFLTTTMGESLRSRIPLLDDFLTLGLFILLHSLPSLIP
ncbi:hypothetical protein [Bacillus safensis]|uniref:hypothetical protein n=1 Tax=Bacillus safensis TaxID=561879 RepID=UPI002FFF8821